MFDIVRPPGDCTKRRTSRGFTRFRRSATISAFVISSAHEHPVGISVRLVRKTPGQRC
jgi:hypothetical protein